MMSPRRKLSWEGSWAEKSNWAWAKLARGGCRQSGRQRASEAGREEGLAGGREGHDFEAELRSRG